MRRLAIIPLVLAAGLVGFAIAKDPDQEPGAWRAVVTPAVQKGKRAAPNDFAEVPGITGVCNQLSAQGYTPAIAVLRDDGTLLILAKR